MIKQGETFDPFKDETSFLLGAFIVEDVGVYLTPEKATSGGFFPAGVNGEVNTSG